MMINLKKGIVATTLTCSLLLSSPFQGVQAAELRDIQGHWAQEEIAYVVNNGIQIPFGNATFSPKDEITRAEFTSLVVQALQYESDGASNQVFADVPLDLWYSPDIQIAFEEGIIHGDENGLFRPDDLITRAEIATIIHRTFSDLDLIRPKVSFRDVGQKHWAYDSISFASQAGIVVGHLDFTFKPIQPATRAEAFVMISRILRGGVSELPPEIEPDIEVLEWSEAATLFSIGKNATVIDVYTGKTFQVQRTYGVNHADVEPLTSGDTEIMREIWGGFTWDTRPVIIEIEDRRIAAAMHNMPHGVQKIRNNNYNGHTCIHFLGSTKHKDGSTWAHMQRDVRIAAGGVQ